MALPADDVGELSDLEISEYESVTDLVEEQLGLLDSTAACTDDARAHVASASEKPTDQVRADQDPADLPRLESVNSRRLLVDVDDFLVAHGRPSAMEPVAESELLVGQLDAAEMGCLGLKVEDLTVLKSAYLAVQKRKPGGSLRRQEFLNQFSLADTPFNRRVFKVMDANHTGDVNFEEFVVFVTHICASE